MINRATQQNAESLSFKKFHFRSATVNVTKIVVFYLVITMDTVFNSFPNTDNVVASEILDGEEIYSTSSTAAATTTTSIGVTTTVPIVVGELSSDIELTMVDTTLQRSFSSQQHRTVSGMEDVVDDTNDGVEVLVTANFVATDEEMPITNQVIEDDDIDDEEEEDEYEYEDDDYAAFSGFIVNNDSAIAGSFLSHSDMVERSNSGTELTPKPATIEEDIVPNTNDQQESSSQLAESTKPKWRQPSEEAVNMSLRAEKEKSGNKRRLALDLYRIMNQDTDKAGFTLVPSSEDSMDNWTIKLFQFDEDSKLAQDMKVLSVPCIELEMKFPDQYPFEPPFVRVTQPRFRRQTGFVMNGALCMELLTKVIIFVISYHEALRPTIDSFHLFMPVCLCFVIKDGWNPINDIESVIVSIRSLLVVGDGRLEAAVALPEAKYNALLGAANQKMEASSSVSDESPAKKHKSSAFEESSSKSGNNNALLPKTNNNAVAGSYSVSEAQAAYSHLSEYHKKKGWDTSGWWARKG